jgi:hypothetical protein
MGAGSAILVAVLCVGVATGCDGAISGPPGPVVEASQSIPTAQLSPTFRAQDFGDGSGMHVIAALFASDDAVQLSAGDALTATASSQSLPLTLATGQPPGSVPYVATFPSATAANPVTIAFQRAQGSSAPSSSTVVPAPFSIVTPAPPYISPPHSYSLLLDPPPPAPVAGSGESWQLTMSGPCIVDYVGSTADGSLTLNAKGELLLDTTQLAAPPPGTGGGSQQQGEGGCVLTVVVRHEHYGPVDPAFGPQADVPDAGPSGLENAPPGTSWPFEGVQARTWNTVLAR